jgi:hypothetical protein
MTDDEKYLRHLIAMFAMNGIVSKGITGDMVEDVAHNAYTMADAMLNASKIKEDGIVSIPKRTKK